MLGMQFPRQYLLIYAIIWKDQDYFQFISLELLEIRIDFYIVFTYKHIYIHTHTI